eukprot:3940282-Rhodomonas_salina.2
MKRRNHGVNTFWTLKAWPPPRSVTRRSLSPSFCGICGVQHQNGGEKCVIDNSLIQARSRWACEGNLQLAEVRVAGMFPRCFSRIRFVKVQNTVRCLMLTPVCRQWSLHCCLCKPHESSAFTLP